MSSRDAVVGAKATGGGEQLIPRYTFAERANHWIGALAYIYLLATGLAFWTPYLFWLAAVVGGGFVARYWHPWIGLLFTASFFWMFLQWRGDMRVTPADRAWFRSIAQYIRNEDANLPATSRFNFGQKLFTWGMFWSIILMFLSGLALWFTDSLPWSLRYLRYAAIVIHASVAMITIGLFLVHVYMSTILEEGSFGAMVHGTVTRAWARTFHRTWYDEVTGSNIPRR
jgi:formate dehydrogenase subunit gamma